MGNFFKCEHRNERSDMVFHIYFINSEKKIKNKNKFPKNNSKW